MAYVFTVGNGVDEDITITMDIGAGAANPAIKFVSADNTIQIAHDGTTFIAVGGASSITTWEAPMRIGAARVWPDATNNVIRWSFGSDPANEQDGAEFGGFTDFAR